MKNLLLFVGAVIMLNGCASELDNNLPDLANNLAEKTVGSAYNEICSAIIADDSKSAVPFSLGDLQSRFLDSHNRDRQRFGLPNLTWDPELARYAQRWADNLKNTFGCEMRHRQNLNQTEGKQYGENLAFMWTSRTMDAGTFHSSPDRAVYNWDIECRDYDLNANTCAAGKQCGHFTQNVWENSSRVGCGVAVCNAGDVNFNRGGRAEVWVCNYDPPGNMSVWSNGALNKLKPFSESKTVASSSAGQGAVPAAPVVEQPPKSAPSAPGKLGYSASARVVLYGNPNCGLCKASERILSEKGIKYEFHNVMSDMNLLMRISQEVGSGKRFPYAFVDGKYVGGYPELQTLISENKLTNQPGQASVTAGQGAEPPAPVVAQPPKPTPSAPGTTLGYSSSVRVVLYGNPGCGFCVASEQLLSEKGIKYEFNNIWTDTALRTRLYNEVGAKRFPYVFVDGKYVGGYPELQTLISENTLTNQPSKPSAGGSNPPRVEPAPNTDETRVKIYGDATAGLGERIKNMLKKEGITYKFLDPAKNPGTLKRANVDVTKKKAPYVFVDGVYIGSYTPLKQMIDSKKLVGVKKPVVTKPSDGIRVKVYGTTTSVYGGRVKNALVQAKVSYKFLDPAKSPLTLKRANIDVSQKNPPFVFVDDKYIGGYIALQRMIDAGKLGVKPAANPVKTLTRKAKIVGNR